MAIISHAFDDDGNALPRGVHKDPDQFNNALGGGASGSISPGAKFSKPGISPSEHHSSNPTPPCNLAKQTPPQYSDGGSASSPFLHISSPEDMKHLTLSTIRAAAHLQGLAHSLELFDTVSRAGLVKGLTNVIESLEDSLSILGLSLKLVDQVTEMPVAWVECGKGRKLFSTLTDLADYLGVHASYVSQRKRRLVEVRNTEPNVWCLDIKGHQVMFTEYGLYGSLPRGPKKSD